MDALASQKYYHFIRLMGRAASNIALECALQTRPNVCLISEEVQAKSMPLKQVRYTLGGVFWFMFLLFVPGGVDLFGIFRGYCFFEVFSMLSLRRCSACASIIWKLKTSQIVDDLVEVIVKRSETGKNYGVVMLPEGLIEFIPEFNTLISDINEVLASGIPPTIGKHHLGGSNQRLMSGLSRIY